MRQSKTFDNPCSRVWEIRENGTLELTEDLSDGTTIGVRQEHFDGDIRFGEYRATFRRGNCVEVCELSNHVWTQVWHCGGFATPKRTTVDTHGGLCR